MSSIELAVAHGGSVLVLGYHPCVDVFVGALAEARPDLRLLVLRDREHHRPTRWQALTRIFEHTIDADDNAQLMAWVGQFAPTLGCVMSWSRRLPDVVLEAFAGRLLNLHAGDLPRYRGAGGGSWQVLNDETKISAHIQQMQAELDRGPLLLVETEALPNQPWPRDVKAAAARAAERSVLRLAQAIAAGDTLPLSAQDESAALYFPRLSTAQNGWINFTWPANAIERFIRAFSDPYPGAAFRLAGAIYRVRCASLRAPPVALHPFCAGLIVNRTAQSLDVATHDGVLHWHNIVDEKGKVVNLSRFRAGDRCWTSDADLLAARCFRPSQTSALLPPDVRISGGGKVRSRRHPSVKE